MRGRRLRRSSVMTEVVISIMVTSLVVGIAIAYILSKD